MMLDSELRQQKKIVMNLKKKSLWSRKLEEVKKLVACFCFLNYELQFFWVLAASNTQSITFCFSSQVFALGAGFVISGIICCSNS